MSGSSTRRPLVAANWKMYKLSGEAAGFCRRLLDGLGEAAGGGEEAPRVVVFAAFTLIGEVASALAGSPVAVGGQDLHPADEGAHTGDVSAPQLADAGCRWVLTGHSERRRDHGEDDETVALKVEAALRHGLTPILCVGETSEERRGGRTFEVLDRQLAAAVPDGSGAFAVAYEPVWAIGTGDTATPEVAQEAHAHLRRRLAGRLGPERAARVEILYGGSVNPDNAAALIAQPDVDGFLVGGASLDAGRFLSIIAHAGAA